MSNCGAIIIILLVALSVSAFGFEGFDGGLTIGSDLKGDDSTNKIQGNYSNFSLGYIKAGTVEVGSVSWRPDLRLGYWDLGFDVNVPVGSVRPEGYDTFVFRHLGYDDGQKGFRYGVLDGITWGHGLLVKNYSTRTSIPGLTYNDQMGINAYYTFDRVGVHILNTWSHIYGLRLTEKVHPLLILGQTFIADADGVNITQSDGTVNHFRAQSGVGVDATVPLPLGFAVYTEYAQLNNYGRAASTGIKWATRFAGFFAWFDAGYRFVGGTFSPGYFNEYYEINPTNLASLAANAERRDGYFAELQTGIPGILNLDIAYENYQKANGSLLAQAETKLRDNIYLSAYYKQPNFVDFNSLSFEDGAVIGAKIGYKVNPFTTLVTHYRKAYNPALGKVEETQFYEVVLSF